MKVSNFAQSNTVFRPPAELDESQCSSIPAYVGTVAGGSLDGCNVVIVAWQPTAEEREQIFNGSKIFLSCMGQVLPPHVLSTEFPR